MLVVDLLELALNGWQGGVALEAEALPILTVALARLDTFSTTRLEDEAGLCVVYKLKSCGGVLDAEQGALTSGSKALLESLDVFERESAAQ